MDFPVNLKIQVENKVVEVTSEDRIIFFAEKNGDLEGFKTVENVVEDSILLAHNTEPTRILFCWDEDCDTVKSEEIESYVNDFAKETPIDVLEDAKVIFLYQLFHTYKEVGGTQYFMGIVGTIEVYSKE